MIRTQKLNLNQTACRDQFQGRRQLCGRDSGGDSEPSRPSSSKESGGISEIILKISLKQNLNSKKKSKSCFFNGRTPKRSLYKFMILSSGSAKSGLCAVWSNGQDWQCEHTPLSTRWMAFSGCQLHHRPYITACVSPLVHRAGPALNKLS